MRKALKGEITGAKAFVCVMKKKSKRKTKIKLSRFFHFDEKRTKWYLYALIIIFIGVFPLAVVFVSRNIERSYENISPGVVAKNPREEKIRGMVKGYPIQQMTAEISKRDRRVAAFLVSIAKKESNWGRRVPQLDGKDCYNYWGFREKRDRMGTGGHTCFDSPHDAVETVGNRIQELVDDYDRDTPRKMVVWKCGNSCDSHSPQSVQKWILDVDLYYKKLVN